LRVDIGSAEIQLDQDILDEIEQIHLVIPSPLA